MGVRLWRKRTEECHFLWGFIEEWGENKCPGKLVVIFHEFSHATSNKCGHIILLVWLEQTRAAAHFRSHWNRLMLLITVSLVLCLAYNTSYFRVSRRKIKLVWLNLPNILFFLSVYNNISTIRHRILYPNSTYFIKV